MDLHVVAESKAKYQISASKSVSLCLPPLQVPGKAAAPSGSTCKASASSSFPESLQGKLWPAPATFSSWGSLPSPARLSACQPRCSPAVPCPATCTPAAASRVFLGLSLLAPSWCFPVYSFHSPPLSFSSVVHQETLRLASVIYFPPLPAALRATAAPQCPARRARSPGTQHAVSGVITAGQATFEPFC